MRAIYFSSPDDCPCRRIGRVCTFGDYPYTQRYSCLNRNTFPTNCPAQETIDAVAFANWYGERVYESEGNCGDAALLLKDWINLNKEG